MKFRDTKSVFLPDHKRITMFPSLKKDLKVAKNQFSKQQINASLDQKSYRMTSNQIIKAVLKNHDSQLVKFRSTFINQNIEGKHKKKFGGYEIIKDIGKGGFAQVYEVQDTQGRKYAMKQYNLQNALQCFLNQVTIGQLFFDKGKIKAQFQSMEGSQNIIKFVEKFKIGKYGYIIQQLSQYNLSKMLSEIQGVFHNNERVYEVKFKDLYKDLLSKNYLKKIMLEICRSIKILNSAGYTHCDLKLQNIMIEMKQDIPSVKIIDFGSTFELKLGLPKITITPEYMPPELLIILENGSQQYESLNKIDVWSIGCILLEILTGIPLWFRYKCKVQIRGKPSIQLGFFALTSRQYCKIIKKQKQICQNINKIAFTLKQFQKFRPLLKKLLTFNHLKRITLAQCQSQLLKIE